MSVLINTNSAASIASNNLSASNAMLQRSLNRWSSGSKIVNASDDAGGVGHNLRHAKLEQEGRVLGQQRAALWHRRVAGQLLPWLQAGEGVGRDPSNPRVLAVLDSLQRDVAADGAEDPCADGDRNRPAPVAGILRFAGLN